MGVVQVRVDYPATAGFTAGSATANVTVLPKPVTFTLADQDFDYDGSSKTLSFSVSDVGAVSAGMVDASGLTAGPNVGTYTLTVSATGNYTGSASAMLRIWPRIDAFAFVAPPAPAITEWNVSQSVQWPAAGIVRWGSVNADTVSVSDYNGAVVSSAAAGSFGMPVFDVRAAPYTYSITAAPRSGAASMAQSGGTTARLQGPGLDADVSGLSSFPISASGVYTYTVSGNGLSRSATFLATMPPSASASGGVTVTPATVSGTWSATRQLDGPYTISPTDFPTWRIQDGTTVAASSTLTWRRVDDSATGSAGVGDTVLPGTYQFTATFVPPNGNYGPSSTAADWALTVPISIFSSYARVSINGVERPNGSIVRFLPGSSMLVSATPMADYAWGTDWDGTPTIWSGSEPIIADATRASYSTPIPAAVPSLSLTASAYQLGPRVVHFSPVAASYTPMSGPAAGRTYPRTWQNDSGWNAYLGRDGVTFTVSGQSRESSIVGFEIEARPPNGEWFTLASGAPADQALNGPRAEVAQTFSARLGNVLPEKPLIPSNLQMAGAWELRARVRSSVGTWSGWSPVETLNVLVPLQTVSLTGRTLPPVQDAAWFTASNSKTYQFQVWVP